MTFNLRERSQPGTSCARSVRSSEVADAEDSEPPTMSARGRKLTARTPREANSRKKVLLKRSCDGEAARILKNYCKPFDSKGLRPRGWNRDDHSIGVDPTRSVALAYAAWRSGQPQISQFWRLPIGPKALTL